jgi:hypothetical protein
MPGRPGLRCAPSGLRNCRLWRDIGGKVFVDLECKLNHLGQHMYRGDLAESLRVQGRW